jgi:tetratricopeptide (TPR) repeat protein
MADSRESKWLLLVLVSFSLAQSCAGTKHGQSPQRPDQPRSHASTPAKKHMAAGEYQSAIDECNVEYRSHPQDQAFVKEYVKSLEGIKAVADKALVNEDFVSAGNTYTVLLKNYSSFNVLAQRLSFDKAYLNTQLSHCKKSLAAQGFREYRKGNLAGAIASWESLLAIDPDNADIKGAVKTAKLQKKNMHESASGR